MRDYLKRLCSKYGIKLIYSDNEYTILSSRVQNNIPVLQVYSMLSDCPDEISEAIIEYYTKNKNPNLKAIEDYVEDNLYFLGYEIEPPDRMFLQLVNRNPENVKLIRKDSRSKKEVHIQKELKNDTQSDLVEMNILTITSKDFYGNTSKVKPSQTLKTPSENITELDIVVKDR